MHQLALWALVTLTAWAVVTVLVLALKLSEHWGTETHNLAKHRLSHLEALITRAETTFGAVATISAAEQRADQAEAEADNWRHGYEDLKADYDDLASGRAEATDADAFAHWLGESGGIVGLGTIADVWGTDALHFVGAARRQGLARPVRRPGETEIIGWALEAPQAPAVPALEPGPVLMAHSAVPALSGSQNGSVRP